MTPDHWSRPGVMSSLSRPFDKIRMTWGRGRGPRDLRKLAWFSLHFFWRGMLRKRPERVMIHVRGGPIGGSFTVFKMNMFHYTACSNLVLHLQWNFGFTFYIMFKFCFTFYKLTFFPILQPKLWSFFILHFRKKSLCPALRFTYNPPPPSCDNDKNVFQWASGFFIIFASWCA